ncbi:dynamin gtpase [Acanthamoeba castellanii str. Neff]|uniref:Dynamin gtpase n=1 Tax=Acanthamoeba castellanii (strain ATCC 30010 / Neff) TaxID=1257118 RepID=L8H0X1_ACACF|nr:dynamin gtpase [Acanthamoeba castellanii str. Neff]ELR19114.1 dynamin gtpase [Acanthamoeba castellanii str. Neff]
MASKRLSMARERERTVIYLSPEEERKDNARKRKERMRAMRAKDRALDAVRDEASELQAVGVPEHDPNPAKHFTPLPEEVYKSHRQLEEIARVLNSPFGPVEFVLIGQRGHGKSSLIEALSGHIVTHVQLALDGATKRPVRYQFLNSTDISPGAKPTDGVKCMIQRDALFQDYNVEVPLKNLSQEILRRSAVLSPKPIYVTLSAPNALNITFIDTPGLPPPPSAEQARIYRRLGLLRRHQPVPVVRRGSWTLESSILPLARSIDPAFNRSALVFTKFNPFLRSLLGTKELINRYLKGGQHPLLPCFWVTVPSHKVRSKCEQSTAWQEKVWQAHHRDMAYLRDIKAKQKYEPSIGILCLLRFLLKHVWKQYIDILPNTLQLIRQQEKSFEVEQQRFQSELERLSAQGMRSVASKFVATLLHSIHRIVHGTSEATTSITGQTLLEETQAQGSIEWADKSGRVLKADKKWRIPFRMAYIVRRSFYLALDQLKNPRSVEGANQEAARADSNEWSEVEVIGYPYFIHWVKDTFEQFLTANLQKCKEKCFEEFFSTETLYWGYNDMRLVPDADDNEAELLNMTLVLTRTIYEETKDRQIRNILLRLFQYFLFMLEDGLNGHLQQLVSTMNEEDLESKFQVEALRKKLEAKAKLVADAIKESRKREYIFATASADFTVPILTEMQMP